VKLDEIHVKFNEHKDEGYNTNFSVITFQKIFESNTSNTKMSKIAQDHSHAYANWLFDVKDQHLHLGLHMIDEDGNPVVEND
jgi:hypothetical protein